MKRLIIKLLKKSIIEWVMKEIKSGEFKYKLIRRVNATINVPGLNEQEEAALLDRFYNACVDAIDEHIS